METFEFTVIATGLDPHAEEFESRFYDSGCDDAAVAFQKGRILIDFAREAACLEEAIASSVEDVKAAGAKVERVEPDPLVSLADMAARSGLSRQVMMNYFKGDRCGGFPAPRAKVTSNSPLWNWADASLWLFRHDRVSRETALQAMVVSEANEVIDCCGDNFRSNLHVRVQERLDAYV